MMEKMEGRMSSFNKGTEDLIKFMDILREKVTTYSVRVNDEYNYYRDVIKDNANKISALKKYLENLSSKQYNFCSDIKEMIKSDSEVSLDCNVLEQKISLITGEKEVFLQGQEYDEQINKDLTNITLVNTLLKLLDSNNSVQIYSNGKFTLKNGLYYKGLLALDGSADLKGTVKYPNESNDPLGPLLYSGEIKDSKWEGFGACFNKKEDIYFGEFKNNKYNGLGALVTRDNKMYFGVFKDGQLVHNDKKNIKNYLVELIKGKQALFDEI